ncbi:glycosyltransferase family 2 protein [Flavobacterium sp. ZS1P14]|uniref:glycosyltransferase family 2 protein n=1 Tax=Flavobacterium sp. ZS1P14 TaxID=3401729 RepID=UPI003AABCFA9
MIIIYHNGSEVVAVSNSFNLDKANKLSIIGFLLLLAKEYPDGILAWCHISLKEQLNISEIEKLFHHHKLLLSYNPSDTLFLDKSIGYVEESPFIKINKSVTFPTWQMSSMVGGIHSSVLLALKSEVTYDKDFDYFLSSLAKLGMRKGLLCYSEPKLLKQNTSGLSTRTNTYILFRFVKQHYKTQWTFLLLLNLLLYERRFPIGPFMYSLFYKNRSKITINLDSIIAQSSKKVIDKRTIDVIIPTIGRKKYLHDVLMDLKSQIHLPTNVIIVEQNPNDGSKSDLDYLTNEIWPFAIKHIFTHQAGACNARNIALEEIKSEWVFFADDDIRLENNFILKALEHINKFGIKAVSVKCFQKEKHQKENVIFQWMTFGAGCSFVFADSLKNCKFKKGYEFGFGEDGDFGMQLRNCGHDVLYLPEPEILHLKAPVGGFRSQPELQWQKDAIQPKPSPTIMLYQILNNTQEQVRGYKTTLFFKYYKYQTIKNPISYFMTYRKQWERSVFLANELIKRE